ncbi:MULTISPECIES: hypothetical protein [Okeania]|uniref:hypothetical protein n=1 Tax=Okeania TaxID=1458928 RepID=UPI00195FBE52|nr:MULTISPECIES: hypothetical protein [Okeania]
MIIDGKHLKFKNQRNRQMGDGVNKTAKLVINHCLKHEIGTVVFGWNKEQK